MIKPLLGRVDEVIIITSLTYFMDNTDLINVFNAPADEASIGSKYEQLCTYNGVLLHPGFHLLHLPRHHTWKKGGVCSLTKEQIFSWNLSKSGS